MGGSPEWKKKLEKVERLELALSKAVELYPGPMPEHSLCFALS